MWSIHKGSASCHVCLSLPSTYLQPQDIDQNGWKINQSNSDVNATEGSEGSLAATTVSQQRLRGLGGSAFTLQNHPDAHRHTSASARVSVTAKHFHHDSSGE